MHRPLVACLAVALTTPLLPADTILVPAGGDIQAAIELMSDGDTVQLQAGIYPTNQTLSMRGKSLTLLGVTGSQGQPLSVLDGQGTTRLFLCDEGEGPDCVFRNLVLRNGFVTDFGGAMYLEDADPTMDNCVFIENAAELGGGAVVNDGGSPTFIGCRFIENTAKDGGAIGSFGLDTETTLLDCRFERNQVTQLGGAFRKSGGQLIATGCSFIENEAGVGGGLLTNGAGVSSLTDCTFNRNHCTTEAGALKMFSGEVTLSGCTVEGNTTDNLFGGIMNIGGTLLITDSVVCDNDMSQVEGPYTDGGGNCISEFCTQCECPADLDGNGTVDGADLTIILSDWGCTGDGCVGDLDDNGQVDGADLTIILSAWGDCSSM